MAFRPRKVDKILRNNYPAYRWLTAQSRAKAAWRENTLENTMVKMWGRERQWSVVVDCEGATIYGPEGDAVRWEV